MDFKSCKIHLPICLSYLTFHHKPKTMKRLFAFFSAAVLAACILSCGKKPGETVSSATPNTLTDEEKSAGWELLFDGSTLNGWKRYGSDTIGPLWSVTEGVIRCTNEGLNDSTGQWNGSLMTLKQYGNFELSVEWKITPGGNSGIIYHVVEKPEFSTDYATGPEYQVMDDAGWKGDALKDAQKVGSNYDMYPAPDTKKVMPVGEWNVSKIIYKDGHVGHWLNGEKTVEFQEGDADYQERYKKSKWVDFPGWNTFKVGSISLQDHGAPVFYRSIKIRPL